MMTWPSFWHILNQHLISLKITGSGAYYTHNLLILNRLDAVTS